MCGGGTYRGVAGVKVEIVVARLRYSYLLPILLPYALSVTPKTKMGLNTFHLSD